LISCCLLILLYLASAVEAQTGGVTATGMSRAFNPAISVNGLFLGAFSSAAEMEGHDDEHEEHEEGHEEEHTHTHGGTAEGMQVQEVELQLSSFVDPYLKADLTLAMHGSEGIELEEGVVTSLALPANLTLKAGKFYAALGKHNLLHTHQFPFIRPPLVNEHLLGGHGLNEVGLGLDWLLPIAWYAELSAQVLNGDNSLFSAPKGEDLAYLGHLKSFWELGESATLELGGSYATGQNEHERTTQLAGGDLTFKWRPVRRAIYRSLTFQVEYLYASMDHGDESEAEGGLYFLSQYQFARRWWVQGQYDLFGLPKEEEERDHRISGLLAFVPSEFSSFRLQYSRNETEGEEFGELFLQFNFTIGSHPAHRY